MLVTSCLVACASSGCVFAEVVRGVALVAATGGTDEDRGGASAPSRAIPAARQLVEIKCHGLQQKARCRFKATVKPVRVCAVLSLTCYDGTEGLTHEKQICSDWLPDSQYAVKTFVGFAPPIGLRERCPETYIGDHIYSFEKPEPPKDSNTSGYGGDGAS